jgi:hypothetical protein
MVAAKWAAPPSGRSSRVTEVTTACLRPSRAAASATLPGSPGSRGSVRPGVMLQKAQFRVQTCPRTRKVATRLEKHSKMFGHLADWQTVCRCRSVSSPRVAA